MGREATPNRRDAVVPEPTEFHGSAAVLSYPSRP